MNPILIKNKTLWKQRSYVRDVLMGIFLLLLSFLVNYYANFFATIRASNEISDILLDSLPVLNVNTFLNYALVIFLILPIVVHIYKPQWLPFSLKCIALFYVVRSCSMILTHIAPPSNAFLPPPGSLTSKISSGADLFFSGHTGLPFLLMLIFWHNKTLRWIFIISTIIGATTVLLGHLHYSIDIFSAFFITFGIFEFSKFVFKKDYEFGMTS